MTTLNVEAELDVSASSVRVSDSELVVELDDGRTISVPIAWHPRLQHGTDLERQNFEVGPFGIHWPDLDEDISFRGLLLGRKSGEGSASLKFWLDARKKGKRVTLEDFMKSRRKSKSSRTKSK